MIPHKFGEHQRLQNSGNLRKAFIFTAQEQPMKQNEQLSTQRIPVQEFLSLSQPLQAYLQQSNLLSAFVTSFQDIEQLEQNIQSRLSFEHRELLVNTLKRQNEGLTLHANQTKNLYNLESQHCFTITTAHQTNLFGGPLYFIQKAVSAITACQKAKKHYPKYNFVPVYWLGTEDHDFDELNHTTINGQRVEWKDEQGGAVGRYSTENLTSILQEVEQLLGKTKHAIELNELFTKAYSLPTIAEATRYLLHNLLGKHGLLIIDGDDKDLKELFAPIVQKELQSSFSNTAIQTSIQFFEDEFGSTQAHSREINLFYLTDEFRKRIERKGNDFTVVDTKIQFTEEELLKELEQHPERFSPNVILRPLMQEMVLPNIMYVGGGGELTYWLQLKPVFDAVNQAYPMLGLRDTAVYLTKAVKRKLEQLNLSIQDTRQSKEELKKYLAKRDATVSLEFGEQRRALQNIMDEMSQQAKAVDSTLEASARAEEQRMYNAMLNLEKKMLRAQKKQNTITNHRLEVIYDSLYPNNSLQERVENFSNYIVTYGEDWLNWQLENFNLFDQQVKVMVEVEGEA